MKQIQLYYGLAIRRNTKGVAAMRQGIWAEYFHISSSNQTPMHALCPNDDDDDDTWCKYNKAKKCGEVYEQTKHFHVPAATMKKNQIYF